MNYSEESSKETAADETTAILVLYEKVIDETGGITELVIWQVPKSSEFPEGVRYRLACVPAGHNEPAVLYDIHRGKTHHRHFLGQEYPYEFRGVRRLIDDFKSDIRSITSEDLRNPRQDS